MNPDIAAIFRASTSASGKQSIFSYLFLTLVLCSFNSHKGHQQPTDESQQYQKTLQNPDRGGEASGVDSQARSRKKDGPV